MYLPRDLIAHLYLHLQRNNHSLSPPVLILVALEPDALCACRILTSLLKRDYIPHKIKPISGYNDLQRAGTDLIRPMRTTEGGSGGLIVCLGVGALVDIERFLELEVDENNRGGMGDLEFWIIDSRRPYNLANVFGGLPSVVGQGEDTIPKERGVDKGCISEAYRPGKGGIFVFDDGDIQEELSAEQEAYWALAEMPEVEDISDDGASDSGNDDDDDTPRANMPTSGQKRKSWSDREDSEDEDGEDDRPRRRRRSNSSSSIDTTAERPQRHGLVAASNQLAGSSDVSRQGSLSRSSSPVGGPKEPSARHLRLKFARERRKYESVLQEYDTLGTSYSEPISSMMYSLASQLGREDNDLLWNAVVGASSLELYGKTANGAGLAAGSSRGRWMGWNGDRGERIRQIFRDEVMRMNPLDSRELAQHHTAGEESGVIPTTARSPNDMSIRLSPEPRFLLIRHWSLYDSMLHSPYLSTRLHVWNDHGRRRLHKILAKMGISLNQSKQTYQHMDMELKRSLRRKILEVAPEYGLDLVPPVKTRIPREGWGFVRCWGWKACLSAHDVGVVLGAILEVGSSKEHQAQTVREPDATQQTGAAQDLLMHEAMTARFFTAYDALSDVKLLTSHVSNAQYLHRAILRTGTAVIEKRQLKDLRAFWMAVVREGPDVQLFTHPGALVKLALWVAGAIFDGNLKRNTYKDALVLATLDESRGIYVVVGLGSGRRVGADREKEKAREQKRRERDRRRAARKLEKEKEKQARRERLLANGMDDEDIEDDDEDETESEGSDEDTEDEDDAISGPAGRGHGKNRFGNAFDEVSAEIGARVRQDSFEHSVVEIEKEDLSGFLEKLSEKAVIGGMSRLADEG